MALPIAGKILLDTNVFIDYLRAGLHRDWVLGGVRSTKRFLSSIVLMELRIGADTARRRRAIERIEGAFPKERIVAPAADLFSRAGDLFRDLYGHPVPSFDRLAPMNDVLIALTAWRMGATLLTGNENEFRRIGERLSGLRVEAPE